MPRKSGTKSNAKTAIADVLSPTGGVDGGGVVGPIRGQSTRGKRRRTSNNNNTSNGTEIYGSGTIVASNPFDDDHHFHNGQIMTTGKMVGLPPSVQPQMHHPHQHQYLNPQHHSYPHPIYSPSNHHHQHHQFLPHQPQHPMATPQSHYTHHPMMPDHMAVNPNGGHMMHTHSPRGFGMSPGANQNHMIGTSTPPQVMGPAPSHSPYVLPVATTPTAASTPPTPTTGAYQEQMLMQQQLYPTNQGLYCGKCQGEIYQQDQQHISCRASCRASYHIPCSGLTQLACDLLMKENMAEWVCDRCTAGVPRVPFVKYKQEA